MGFDIIKGNCIEILDTIEEKSIDMIFADPPYFLSNNGITCSRWEDGNSRQRKMGQV